MDRDLKCGYRRPVLEADAGESLAHFECDTCFRNRVFEYDAIVAVVTVARCARVDAKNARENALWFRLVMVHVLVEQVGVPLRRRDAVRSEIVGKLVCESANFAVVFVERGSFGGCVSNLGNLGNLSCRWCAFG